MSTKRFCDICGNPADEGLHGKGAEEKIGEPWRGYNGAKECDGVWQTTIHARVIFGFTNHKTGFGGPPDICASCAAVLTRKIAQSIKP